MKFKIEFELEEESFPEAIDKLSKIIKYAKDNQNILLMGKGLSEIRNVVEEITV